jgi:spore germination cell wall hydrolase CwlJ-like protein
MHVASVTLNRVKSSKWPNNICDVVYQPHQFSWTKDKRFLGKTDKHLEKSKIDRDAFANILEQSALAMSGLLNDYTVGATHYHRKDISPAWANRLELALFADTHIYYR